MYELEIYPKGYITNATIPATAFLKQQTQIWSRQAAQATEWGWAHQSCNDEQKYGGPLHPWQKIPSRWMAPRQNPCCSEFR